jgi:hypothetical protein
MTLLLIIASSRSQLDPVQKCPIEDIHQIYGEQPLQNGGKDRTRKNGASFYSRGFR